MNDLLQAELSAFLGYEPYEKVGYNSGNSHNGTYSRKFETKYGSVQLSIPRVRNGNFSPALVPAYGHRDDHLEEMVIKLYQTGVTTREISDIIERMYVITIVLPQFLISQKQLRRMSLLFMSEA